MSGLGIAGLHRSSSVIQRNSSGLLIRPCYSNFVTVTMSGSANGTCDMCDLINGVYVLPRVADPIYGRYYWRATFTKGSSPALQLAWEFGEGIDFTNPSYTAWNIHVQVREQPPRPYHCFTDYYGWIREANIHPKYPCPFRTFTMLLWEEWRPPYSCSPTGVTATISEYV
jgi:hypothetical protein